MPPTAVVVTDREAVAERLMRELERRHGTVVTCASNQLAVRFADVPASTVVVLDLSLPDSTERLQALELVHAVATPARAPMLAILPREAGPEAAQILAAGAADFVLEPLDFDELATRIEV